MTNHDVDVVPGEGGRPATPTLESMMAARLDRRGLLVRAAQAGVAATVGAAVGTRALEGVEAGATTGSGVAEPLGRALPGSGLTFAPITGSTADTVIVPDRYATDLLIQWGEPLDTVTPALTDDDITSNAVSTAAIAANQAKQFGYNCDAIHLFPLQNARWRGIMAVNHEYTEDVVIFPDWNDFGSRAEWVAAHPDAVDFMMNAHGIAMVHVQRQGVAWSVVKSSRYNRRITAFTPITLTGPAAGSPLLRTSEDPSGTTVLGTLNNCAGGATPWGTFLSAEENFEQYFGNFDGYKASPGADPAIVEAHRRIAPPAGASDRGWEHRYDRFDVAKEPNELFRFGWVVEVNPYHPITTPKKRTALGRFKHENAACFLSPANRAVVYSGDDARFEYLYKFVSDGTYDPANPVSGHNLLDAGTLYAAQLSDDGSGTWLPLVWGNGPLTPANGFADQAEVLIKARNAADLLGATPMDRPEDVQVNPVTKTVLMACTNNTSRTAGSSPSNQNGRSVDRVVDPKNPRPSNDWGHIVEITEDGNDHAGTTFTWEILLLCGDPAAASGDLLPSLDGVSLPIPEESTYFAGWTDASVLPPIGAPDNVAFDHAGNLWIITDGRQPTGLNNGCFVVPTTGDERGWLRQFLSGPVAAEVCGAEFSKDGHFLFIAIQHPGETGTVAAPTSHWPNGGASQPRPSVITVRRTQKPWTIGA